MFQFAIIATTIEMTLCLIFYFFYPVIVMRPRWFTWRHVLLFILPWLLVSPP